MPKYVFKRGLENHTPKQEFKRSLFIGLGGSGAKILTRLKRDFIEKYGNVPPAKVFLSIDTDNDLPVYESVVDDRGIRLDRKAEFMYIKVDSPLTAIKESETIQKWLPKNCPTAAITAGTGAVRAVGRFALFANSPKVFRRIRSAFDDLQTIDLPDEMGKYGFDLNDSAIEVYICGSVAGGTGSGTFLDVGIFCRHHLPANTLIYAVMMGPRAYGNLGATYRTPANAYSAFMELDTLMSIGQQKKENAPNVDNYFVTFDRGEIMIDQPPFNVVHLVDGANQQGKIVREPNELIKFISEGIFLSTSANIGGVLRSAVDNILTITSTQNPELWNNKPAYYSSFGASAAVYPADQYIRIGTFRVTEKILQSLKDNLAGNTVAPGEPSEADTQDVAAFLKKVPFDPEKSPAALNNIFDPNNLPPFRLPPPTVDDLRPAYAAGLSSSGQRKYQRVLNAGLDDFKDTSVEYLNAIEDYMRAGSTAPQATTAAEIRATRLKLLLTKLHDIDTHCIETIEQCEQTTRQAQQDITAEISKISEMLAKGLSWFKRSAPLLARVESSFNKYLELMKSKLNEELEKGRLDKHRQALGKAIALLKREFSDLQNTKGTEDELMALSERTLRSLNKRKALHNLKLDAGLSKFEVLVKLSEDDVVPEDEAEQVAQTTAALSNRLEGLLSNTPDDPLLDPDNLLDHIFEAFSEPYTERYYTAKRILDIIRKQRELAGPDDEDETVTTRLLTKLEYLGEPLWHYDPGIINNERAAQMTSVIIIGTEKREKARQLFDEHTFSNECAPNIVSTGDRHRISLINFMVCLPIHALSEMDFYQAEYNKTMIPPVHTSKFLEMNCDAVIPENTGARSTFVVLSISIIPELKLVSDEKSKKGNPGRHRLLFDLKPDREMMAYNLNLRPKLGDKFIDALSALARKPHIHEQLQEALIVRLEDMRHADPDGLRKAIDGQVDKLAKEVERRQMNKIITWRYMQKEIRLLTRLKYWEGGYEDFFV